MKKYDELKKYSLVEIYDYLNTPKGYTGESISVSWLTKHLKPLQSYLLDKFIVRPANKAMPFPVMNYEDNKIIGTVVECLTRYQLNGKNAYKAVNPQLRMHYKRYIGDTKVLCDWFISRLDRMDGYSEEAINAMYNFLLLFEDNHHGFGTPEVKLDAKRVYAIREMTKRSVEYLSSRNLIFGSERVEYGAVVGFIDFRTDNEIIDLKCLSGANLFDNSKIQQMLYCLMLNDPKIKKLTIYNPRMDFEYVCEDLSGLRDIIEILREDIFGFNCKFRVPLLDLHEWESLALDRLHTNLCVVDSINYYLNQIASGSINCNSFLLDSLAIENPGDIHSQTYYVVLKDCSENGCESIKNRLHYGVKSLLMQCAGIVDSLSGINKMMEDSNDK